MAHLRAHILGEQGLGSDEVQLSKSLEHACQLVDVRTYLVSHFSEDADDFAGNL